MARDRRGAKRGPAREPDPVGPRLREPPVARRRAGGRRERPPASVEPVRAGGRPASRDGPGRRSASGDLARPRTPRAAVLHVLVRVHAAPGAAVGLPLLFRLWTRRARGDGRRGRVGLLDLRALLGRVERGAGDGDLPAVAARPSPARARAGPRGDRPDGRRAVARILRRTPRVLLPWRRRGRRLLPLGALRGEWPGTRDRRRARSRRARPAAVGPAALSAPRGDPALRGVPRAPAVAGIGERPPVGAAGGGGEAASSGRAAVRPRHLRPEPRPDAAQRRLRDAPRLRRRGALPAGSRGSWSKAAGRARTLDLPRLRARGPRVRREPAGPPRSDFTAARVRARPQLPAGVPGRPGALGPGGFRGPPRRDGKRRPAARGRLRGRRRRAPRGVPSLRGRSSRIGPCRPPS